MSEHSLPALRGDLSFTLHQQGDQHWYAVQDPASGHFTRLGRTEYLLACSLDGKRDAAAVLASAQQAAPEIEADEDSVLRLVAWLTQHRLVQSANGPAAMTTLKASRSGLSWSLLYVRIPLVKGHYLERLATWLQPVVSPLAVLFALLLALIAAISVVANWDLFGSRAGQLFVPDGRLWWIVAWLILKAAHEMGHAIVAVRVGSQIRSAGISLICLAPVPYVDISDLWTISNRWHRMWCCAAGMLVEISLAAAAALIALTTDNLSIQYLCCAVATLGTVTTLLFNMNPLVRFDGYFILSDCLNRPNLWSEAGGVVRQAVRRVLRPGRPATQPVTLGLLAYGSACFIYRVFLLTSLAAWALLVWQGLGVVLVIWGGYSIVIAPWIRQRRQSALARQQGAAEYPPPSWAERGLGWSLIGLCAGMLFILPAPIQPSAPGVVSLHDPQTIRLDTEGFLSEVLVAPGQSVEAGQVLARLQNPELALDLASKQNQVCSAEEKMHSLRARGDLGQLQAESAKLRSLQAQLEQLESQVDQLEVRAPIDGRVAHSDLHRQIGRFFDDGDPLCVITGDEPLEILASIDQQDATFVRSALGQDITVYLADGGRTAGRIHDLELRGSRRLNQPVLAAAYGGPLTVELEPDARGTEQLQLLEPRFEARIRVSRTAAEHLVPGQLASIRIPGRRASLWDGLRRWATVRWTALVRQSQASS